MTNLKRTWFLLFSICVLYIFAYLLPRLRDYNTTIVYKDIWKLDNPYLISATNGSRLETNAVNKSNLLNSSTKRNAFILHDILRSKGFRDVTSSNKPASSGQSARRTRHGIQNLSPEAFIDEQLDVCKHEEDEFNSNKDKVNKSLCECFPPSLLGEVQVNKSHLMTYTWRDVESKFSNLDFGGHWKPKNCVPRRQVAILIPYRDRKRQLLAFLAHMHPILQRQLVEYQIFVVEQRYPYVFNKGAIMNAGYLTLNKTGFKPDCIVFHDVDMLMLTDISIFMCLPYPVHLAAYLNKFNFRLGYKDIFGGAVSIKADQFKLVNGFSNKFKGWGGEDDDFSFRVNKRLGHSFRSPRNISRYFMLRHKHDIGNPISDFSRGKVSRTVFNTNRIRYLDHGLNTIKFQIIEIEYLPLFTHIVIDITDPPRANVSGMKSFIKLASTRCPSDIYQELPVSQVTCEGVCLQTANVCQAYQYINNQEVHLTCQLLSKVCEHPLSGPVTNLYIRK